MKKLFSFFLFFFVAGCQLTEPQETISQVAINEEPASLACGDSNEQSDGLQSCDIEADAGTIAVTHPVDHILQPLPSLILPEKEPDTIEAPAPITNAWERVKQQLTFAVPDNKRIRAQRNWYLKHPKYLQRVSKRAEPFLHYIVTEIEKHNLPLELTLLPIVESAFDPFAYSHGRAAGMWQFIPGTGKRFKMKQNWWYDGRRDVITSTQGAINYLKYLHKYFDGNWLHALAAYNSGEGRVKKAIRKNRKKGKGTDFWSLDLPLETRAYVPKLLALADILQHHEKYSFTWPHIENKPAIEIVDTQSQIDLAFAADLAGLSLNELHALNSGFNRWATDPKGPHYLVVPISKAKTFKQELAQITEKDRFKWVRHKVKRGDSLLKLAKQYHTSVDVLRRVNDMKGNVIVAGKHLMIPVAQKSLEQYQLSEDQRLVSTQKRKRKGYQLKHKVKPGDNMWDLSRHYKVNMRSMAKWNGMAPTDPLQIGQELVVWVNQVSEEQQKQAVMRTLTYTVRRGDSIARIANKFNVKMRDLTKWNQLNSKKYLQPGQKLKIFVDVTRT